MPIYERMRVRRLRSPPTASTAGKIIKECVKKALVAGTYSHIDVLEHAQRLELRRETKQGAAAHLPEASTHSPPARNKPIGASLSFDEALFKFKTAHPWSAEARACRPVGNQRIVSLSKPIRAVLTADILVSLPPPVLA